jgi:hypothetical protein
MSTIQFFEYIRWTNADFYTAHPLAQLSEAELAHLAEQNGLTVTELRTQMTTPSEKLTCPLCGQPATHLVNCGGCGGDAFGAEWLDASRHGEDLHQRLRTGLKTALSQPPETGPSFSPAQIEAAPGHAYQWGGCHICASCWHHTLPADAYQTCPHNLQADRTFAPDQPPAEIMVAVFTAKTPEARAAAVKTWLEAAWQRWTIVWNTTADAPVREAIAAWRHPLLAAVWRKD